MTSRQSDNLELIAQRANDHVEIRFGADALQVSKDPGSAWGPTSRPARSGPRETSSGDRPR
jgi:hypothetical protein